jgi:hypothetical protein
MRRFTKKQYLVAGVAAAIIAGTAGSAIAYWTTTGSGTGSGTTAASNGNVVLHASFTSATLTPGGNTPVSFTADNAGSSNLHVGTVTTVVTASGTCDASWFTVAPVLEDQTIAGTSTTALANSGSLVFADSTTVNQDACKSATITLTLSSN